MVSLLQTRPHPGACGAPGAEAGLRVAGAVPSHVAGRAGRFAGAGAAAGARVQVGEVLKCGGD